MVNLETVKAATATEVSNRFCGKILEAMEFKIVDGQIKGVGILCVNHDGGESETISFGVGQYGGFEATTRKKPTIKKLFAVYGKLNEALNYYKTFETVDLAHTAMSHLRENYEDAVLDIEEIEEEE